MLGQLFEHGKYFSFSFLCTHYIIQINQKFWDPKSKQIKTRTPKVSRKLSDPKSN